MSKPKQWFAQADRSQRRQQNSEWIKGRQLMLVKEGRMIWRCEAQGMLEGHKVFRTLKLGFKWKRAEPTQQAFIEVNPHTDVLHGLCRWTLGHGIFCTWFQSVGLSLWRQGLWYRGFSFSSMMAKKTKKHRKNFLQDTKSFQRIENQNQ